MTGRRAAAVLAVLCAVFTGAVIETAQPADPHLILETR